MDQKDGLILIADETMRTWRLNGQWWWPVWVSPTTLWTEGKKQELFFSFFLVTSGLKVTAKMEHVTRESQIGPNLNDLSRYTTAASQKPTSSDENPANRQSGEIAEITALQLFAPASRWSRCSDESVRTQKFPSETQTATAARPVPTPEIIT